MVVKLKNFYLPKKYINIHKKKTFSGYLFTKRRLQKSMTMKINFLCDFRKVLCNRCFQVGCFLPKEQPAQCYKQVPTVMQSYDIDSSLNMFSVSGLTGSCNSCIVGEGCMLGRSQPRYEQNITSFSTRNYFIAIYLSILRI